MISNFWCSLGAAAAELHLCFVIKGNVWWKCTFLPMVTIVVLLHKYMKLFKPFTPHVIAWSVRRGFQSVDSQNERAENEIAVFSLGDAAICNAMRCYEKCKASKKKAQGFG